jgi:hypothetical protein
MNSCGCQSYQFVATAAVAAHELVSNCNTSSCNLLEAHGASCMVHNSAGAIATLHMPTQVHALYARHAGHTDSCMRACHSCSATTATTAADGCLFRVDTLLIPCFQISTAACSSATGTCTGRPKWLYRHTSPYIAIQLPVITGNSC